LVELPLSISIPPFCEGVPVSSELSTRTLSPIFTVFEFTVVVVPFTVKLPVTITLSENVLFPPILSVPVTLTYLESNDEVTWSEPLTTPLGSKEVTSPKLKTPLPFVTSACPFVPSDVGNLYALLKVIAPPSLPSILNCP